MCLSLPICKMETMRTPRVGVKTRYRCSMFGQHLTCTEVERELALGMTVTITLLFCHRSSLVSLAPQNASSPGAEVLSVLLTAVFSLHVVNVMLNEWVAAG